MPFLNDIRKFGEKYRLTSKKPLINLRYKHLPTKWYLKLEKEFGCRPNTGVLSILDIARYNPKEIYVTGFTFMKNGYYSQYRPCSENFALNYNKKHGGYHIQSNQIKYMRKWISSRNFITPDPTLGKMLNHNRTVFVVTSNKLYPVSTGSISRILNMIKLLHNKKFQVVLISLTELSSKATKVLRNYIDDIIQIPVKLRDNTADVHPDFNKKIREHIDFYQPKFVMF